MSSLLDEVAARSAYLIAETLQGVPVTSATCRGGYELGTRDYLCCVTAADGAPDHFDRDLLRKVASSEVPMLVLQLSSPWDLGWEHEPCVNAVLKHKGDVPAQILDGRLFFGDGEAAIIARDHSRRFVLTSQACWLSTEKFTPRSVAEGRFAAIAAWQFAVARPARLS